jgi:cytochrome P450
MAINRLHTHSARSLSDLPSPAGLPLIGHLHRIDPLKAHITFEAWAKELGPAYTIRLGRERVVVFTDSRLARDVLQDRPAGFTRGRRILPVAREMGFEGVFAAEGADWAMQRRRTTEAFFPAHLPRFLPVISEIAERLHGKLARMARAGEIIDIGRELMRFTVDVTSALAFGQDPRTIEGDGHSIQAAIAEIFPVFMKRVMSPFPYWHYVKPPSERRADAALERVKRHIETLIAEAEQRLAERGADVPPDNLLEALILGAQDEGETDLPRVSANVLTLLLAGEDTTAHTIAWALYYIVQDQSLQGRLHAEAMAANSREGPVSTMEEIRTLALAEACGMEALRLKPVVPFQSFVAQRDIVLGDLVIPRDTMLFFLNRPSLLDADHFADPLNFRPDRWLAQADGRGPRRAHDPRAFLQFGAGPRVCPGRNLAMLEIKLVLSMLLRQFKLELALPADRIEEVQAFTMGPKSLPVRLIPRDQTRAATLRM